jgi:hypothetical protein
VLIGGAIAALAERRSNTRTVEGDASI